MTITISRIATYAAQQRIKATRAQAYAALIELANRHDVGDPDLPTWAALYAHLAPRPTRTPKTPFGWVALAVSHEATRPYLNYVYVGDGVTVATDDHRLHAAPTDLPDGFYDRAGYRVDVGVTFPSWQRVVPAIPRIDDYMAFDVGQSDVRVHPHAGGPKQDRPLECYVLPNGTWVNKSYMDAARYGRNTVRVYQQGPLDPVRLAFDGAPDLIAVIMPVRPPKGA